MHIKNLDQTLYVNNFLAVFNKIKFLNDINNQSTRPPRQIGIWLLKIKGTTFEAK